MAIIQAHENSEFNLSQEIYAFENSEFYHNNELLAFENSEFLFLTELEAFENSEFFYFTSDVYNTITFTTPDTDYLEFIQPVTYFKLEYHGASVVDYTPFVRSLKVTKTLGGKTYCDLEMIEYGDGNITEFLSDIGAGLAGDKIVSLVPQLTNPIFASMCNFPLKFHGFNAGRYLTLTVSIGYPGQPFQSYTYCHFLPSTLSFDGTTLQLKLEDFTVLLEKENQNISPDIDSDNGSKGSAHALTKAMAAAYGINSVALGYPDYPVRLLRRTQGRPLDWIDKISNIYQAKRQFIGNTLHIKPTLTADESTAKWTLLGHKHIIAGSFSLDVDLSDYKNKFSIVRTSSNGGIIGEQECIGYNCPGRTGNITFDYPVNYASATYEVTYGALEDFVYYTDSDTVVGGSPINWPSGLAIASAVPVTNVKFTYRPQIGATPLQGDGSISNAYVPGYNQLALFAYMPRYKVTFRGKKNSNSEIDTDYKFTAQDTDGITCLGLHEEYGDIEDPIIPNSSVAQAYVAALLKESTRKVLNLNLDTPFVNPFMETGDCVAITDYETNMSGMKWILESHSISIEGNTSKMSLSLSRGRT